MKRTSSMQGIMFGANPHEFKIGESRIDSLPIKMANRRSSLRHIPKQQPPQQKSQLEVLRQQNSALRHQNEHLKRQLEYLQQKSTAPVMKTEQKVSAYRDLIKNKFTTRTKTSRITTECETGLFSSKEVSLDRSQMTISELYDNYKLSNKLPSLMDLHEITDKFFKDYCHNYTKIKALFQCLNVNKKQIEYLKLSELLELYKVPLLYQRSPQALFRELSKSKEKPKMKKQKGEQICLEVLSPQQTVVKFEGLLQKLCRSSQMIRLLKSNEHVIRFIAKIENAKH